MKKTTLLIATIVLAGCSSDKNTADESQSPSVGMANPASVYCVETGGKSEIEETAAGQTGYCLLPSGEKIEEWALYRRDHK